MFLPCWQCPSQKDLKGRCNSPPAKTSNWCGICGWIWLFYLEPSELRAFQELKLRKNLRTRCISRLGTILKNFYPRFGLSAAGMENALCILTSHRTSVLAKPTAEPPATADTCLLHILPVIHLPVLPSQRYTSWLYLCYLLPMLKSPRKINRAPFFSTVISAPFIKVIRT